MIYHSVCAWLIALAALALTGCSTMPSSGSFGRGDAIHELHLLVLPVALKSNPFGAADGVAVRVFASSRSRAKGVVINRGTLEILAFDGAITDPSVSTAKPAQIWTFPATSLLPFVTATSLGTGYELALPWRGPRPTSSRVTLAARYTTPAGEVLRSAPSVLSNSLR